MASPTWRATASIDRSVPLTSAPKRQRVRRRVARRDARLGSRAPSGCTNGGNPLLCGPFKRSHRIHPPPNRARFSGKCAALHRSVHEFLARIEDVVEGAMLDIRLDLALFMEFDNVVEIFDGSPAGVGGCCLIARSSPTSPSGSEVESLAGTARSGSMRAEKRALTKKASSLSIDSFRGTEEKYPPAKCSNSKATFVTQARRWVREGPSDLRASKCRRASSCCSATRDSVPRTGTSSARCHRLHLALCG